MLNSDEMGYINDLDVVSVDSDGVLLTLLTTDSANTLAVVLLQPWSLSHSVKVDNNTAKTVSPLLVNFALRRTP